MEGLEQQEVMMEGSEDLMSTSATSTNGSDTNGCGGRKSSITSPDPTSYVTKARVTKPTPPPPSKNPMQFVQIKPCNLYQTAQQQLKKAEEVKKLKEVQKEEPEEWQNNLDNWKSSRRKRVEHIIDRVVETKKLELEEHDRTRRKSKTLTEMMEERAERGGSRGRVKLASLAVYNEDEANDLSDLGIGTSSASGKSSLSEDYGNNSVMSYNAAELDKAIGGAGSGSGAACASGGSVEEQQNHINSNGSNGNSGASGQATTSKANASKAASAGAMREYISSPGYDTSSSTAPASSPDPCEYTYEGAIQDYKQRVQRASNNGNGNGNANGKMSTSPSSNGETIAYPTRRGSKIEDRLSGFEVTSPSDTQEGVEKQKVDVPKVDISKRKEIFEQAKSGATNGAGVGVGAGAPSAAPKVVLRDRLTNGNSGASNGSKPQAKQEIKRLSGDISSIRDRMQSLEQQRNAFNHSKSVDVPVPPLKQRLNSLQQSVTKEDQQKKPPLVALIDARQLEIMRGEEERMRQQQQQQQHQNQKQKQQQTPVAAPPPPALVVEEAPATAAGTGTNDDSGIHEDTNEELQQQQLQLNAAIAALAIEERQLEEAANAVNQIEAEFDELTDLNPSPLPHQQPQQQPQQQQQPAPVAVPPPEVIMCAPPVTIVHPEELPKPNTVKALSNCFSQTSDGAPPSVPSSPRPLPRSRIPQITTPPASPKPNKRVHMDASLPSLDVVDRSSGDYAPVVGQTRAIVHSPPSKIFPAPAPAPAPTRPPTSHLASGRVDPLAPNDSLLLHTSSPCEMPALKVCLPNESSLFKLASSRPTSPSVEMVLCQQFLDREAPKDLQLSAEDREHLEQMAIEEMPCDKIDVAKAPLPSTGYQSVSEDLVKRCDGYRQEKVQQFDEKPSEEDIALCAGLLDCLAPAQEPLCDSIDVKKSPVPATGFQDINDADVKRCDGATGRLPIVKPSSPIGTARAAHSKALMDTCEQIIAEERLASSQMIRSSLPEAASSPATPSTPLLGRKSKIPIPKPCCISASGTDSISRAGYAPTSSPAPEQPLIARTHLVETEIKVKQVTPPSSPKQQQAPPPTPPPVAVKEKKTKNIFDFLRRNFGHHEEAAAQNHHQKDHHPTLNETLEKKVILTSTRSGVDVVTPGDFVQVDNSKFYIAKEHEEAAGADGPPPLPKTPAPVNIEISKTITTDEILEENTTEKALTQEISDLLDDEIIKLGAAAASTMKK
ncbi:uncharacterized protein CG43427 isoform X4 [Drosophila miranda]|uniref:uncharacterized protein CG43427 isoform X4 n=1 Tax=Drosophila miranda TaxID=7229 RepID=UPI00143F7E55|nr:uncharacterized protein CG43427 isoform X4 [Drosophila miranda]